MCVGKLGRFEQVDQEEPAEVYIDSHTLYADDSTVYPKVSPQTRLNPLLGVMGSEHSVIDEAISGGIPGKRGMDLARDAATVFV